MPSLAPAVKPRCCLAKLPLSQLLPSVPRCGEPCSSAPASWAFCCPALKLIKVIAFCWQPLLPVQNVFTHHRLGFHAWKSMAQVHDSQWKHDSKYNRLVTQNFLSRSKKTPLNTFLWQCLVIHCMYPVCCFATCTKGSLQQPCTAVAYSQASQASPDLSSKCLFHTFGELGPAHLKVLSDEGEDEDEYCHLCCQGTWLFCGS